MKKTKMGRCACCGNYTIPIDEMGWICPVCDWEDDWWESSNPDQEGCINGVSLNAARELFRKYGDKITNHKDEYPECPAEVREKTLKEKEAYEKEMQREKLFAEKEVEAIRNRHRLKEPQ